MPIISIEIGKKYSQEQEIAIMEAVQSALREEFKVVNNDINVRLFVHEAHRFLVPKTNPEMYTHPELYTHINIDCIEGRSLETKRNLYRHIVDNLEALGIPKDHVKILLRETTKENWGIRGGKPACDVEMGYKVQV